ncbi:MAG: glycosyltransferase [Actinomycetota bacterium]|nr:glycosyltransferase [Actinomycetota bacterium]
MGIKYIKQKGDAIHILYEIFWGPVAQVRAAEWAVILAPGLIFDFGWGYLIRTVGLTGSHLKYGRARRRRLKGIRFAESQVELLEPELGRAREELARAREVRDNNAADRALSQVSSLRNRLQAANIDLARLVEPPYHPKVSIIIPVHNGAEVIEETLRKIRASRYPDFETIVVDDGSTDDTAEKVAKFDWVNLVRRATSSGRKTGAINFGLNYASGQVIVVIDDDTPPEPDAVAEVVQPLRQSRIAAAGGNIQVFASRRNLLVRLQELEYLKTMELGRAWQSLIYNAVVVISGAFGAFNRDYLAQIGDYDIETITEDLDVTWKLYKLHRMVGFAPYAYAKTDVPVTLSELKHQRRRWDLGLLQTVMKHRNLVFNRRFGKVGLFMLPEAIILELLLVAIKPFYILILIFRGVNLAEIALISLYFYLVIEVLSIFTAALFSNKKKWALRIYYAPLMILYYTWLAGIRWTAIIAFIRGKEMRWDTKGA